MGIKDVEKKIIGILVDYAGKAVSDGIGLTLPSGGAHVNQILDITIEVGKCPKCKGTGWGQFYFNRQAHCDDCNGKGRATKTIREILEEAINGRS